MAGPAACLCAAAWPAARRPRRRLEDAPRRLLRRPRPGPQRLTLAGVSVSHLDVAPRHAGLVFATGNTCAAPRAVAVPFSGLVLERTGRTGGGVRIIAAVYVVGGGGVVRVGRGRARGRRDALGRGGGEEAAAG